MKEIKKIVLAYSGGLDTSIIIPWAQGAVSGLEVEAGVYGCGPGKEDMAAHW